MKKWQLFTLVLSLVFLLAACGSDDTSNESEKAETNKAEQTSADAETSAYPLTISSTVTSTESEEAGTINYEDVTFETMPEKIVVFDYGFLDTLNTLGVEGVVGLAKDSSLPAHLSEYASDEYASVGSLKEPLLEDIAELSPDVIFISGRQAPFYEQLSEIAPVVFVGTSQDDYWNTFLKSVDVAATMFDKEDEAAEHIAKIESAIEEVKTLAGNYDNVLVTMYNEGKLSGFSTNSRFGYIYDIYGFVPVTEDIEASSHGSNFGFEAILEFNPQVLFVIDRTAATGGESNIEADLENDIIKKTTAFENGNIVYLKGPKW